MKNDVLEVNEISFRRVKNTGDYNSVAFEAKAMVIADDADVAADTLAEYVDGFIQRTIDAKTKPTKKVAKKKTTKKASSKKEVASKEEPNTNTEVGSEGCTTPRTIEDVRAALKEVWKSKGRNAMDILLREFGVEKTSELKEEQYNEVITKANSCLK